MQLEVKVDGDSIIIANPGTDMWEVYEKDPDGPGLLCTDSWLSGAETAPTVALFRAQAFQAALAKARELGWLEAI